MAADGYLTTCFGGVLADGCEQVLWSSWLCIAEAPVPMTLYDAFLILWVAWFIAKAMHVGTRLHQQRLVVFDLAQSQGAIDPAKVLDIAALQPHSTCTGNQHNANSLLTLLMSIAGLGLWLGYLCSSLQQSADPLAAFGMYTPRSLFWCAFLGTPLVCINLQLLQCQHALQPFWFRVSACAVTLTTGTILLVMMAAHGAHIIALGIAFGALLLIQCTCYGLCALLAWMCPLGPRAQSTTWQMLVMEPFLSKATIGYYAMALIACYVVFHVVVVGVLGALVRAWVNGSAQHAGQIWLQAFAWPTLWAPAQTLLSCKWTCLTALVVPWTVLDQAWLLISYALPQQQVFDDKLLANMRCGQFLRFLVTTLCAADGAISKRTSDQSMADKLYFYTFLVCSMTMCLPFMLFYWELDLTSSYDEWTYYSTPVLCVDYWKAMAPVIASKAVVCMSAGAALIALGGMLIWCFPMPSKAESELFLLARIVGASPSATDALVRAVHSSRINGTNVDAAAQADMLCEGATVVLPKQVVGDFQALLRPPRGQVHVA